MAPYILTFIIEYFQTVVVNLLITYFSMGFESLFWNWFSKQTIKN